MTDQIWSLAEAKAKLSAVVEKARCVGPQTITRDGRPAAVVVFAEEWDRGAWWVGGLAPFFARAPLRGAGLRIERSQDAARKLDL